MRAYWFSFFPSPATLLSVTSIGDLSELSLFFPECSTPFCKRNRINWPVWNPLGFQRVPLLRGLGDANRIKTRCLLPKHIGWHAGVALPSGIVRCTEDRRPVAPRQSDQTLAVARSWIVGRKFGASAHIRDPGLGADRHHKKRLVYAARCGGQ